MNQVNIRAEEALKLYLDTSALNRIFDDQSQARIYLEATAMQVVFLLVEQGGVVLISSDALVYEMNRNPFTDRQAFVSQVLARAVSFQTADAPVVARARALEANTRIKGLDAFHLACAEKAGADYFVTCDNRMIRQYNGTMPLLTPLELVKMLV
jgi:predicted nucleic acid-binding protein